MARVEAGEVVLPVAPKGKQALEKEAAAVAGCSAERWQLPREACLPGVDDEVQLMSDAIAYASYMRSSMCQSRHPPCDGEKPRAGENHLAAVEVRSSRLI